MKLELEQNIVDKDLFIDLDFSSYLSLFEHNVPFLPAQVLRPLERQNGTEHFDRLKKVQKHFTDLTELINSARRLPNIEHLIPFFRQGRLEQFHFYLLGHFVDNSLTLDQMEKSFPVAERNLLALEKMQKVLEKYTNHEYSNLRFDDQLEKLKGKIESNDRELSRELADFEREIQNETNLKMIYPYPREVPEKSELVPAIKNFRYLKIKKQGETYLVEYNLPPRILSTISRQENLNKNFKELLDNIIEKFNRELTPFFEAFVNYYELRKRRVYDYCLLKTATDHALNLPTFQKSPGINLKNGRLPVLAEAKNDQYRPLDIDLHKGANILFGANMAGKTTVLKTIFFHLSCVRFGLPVPAGSFSLSFPRQVEMCIKSSGNLSNNVSTFGEELQFFSREMEAGAFVLADEFFHSTNPVGGVVLSKIFLEEFSNSEIVFFCNTHFPETLRLTNVNLYKMKDIDFQKELELDDESEYRLDLTDLVEKMPYEVEQISPESLFRAFEESNRPLYTALYFPLPKPIKKNISKYLKQQTKKSRK